MTLSQKGFTVWLTGLPCSGKSTISRALADVLRHRGCNVELLDGDIVRTNLSRGLGFSREDRDINVKRIGFVAQLLSRNGVAVIVAAVSPYREARQYVRSRIASFVEVHVDCSVAVCEARDVKGMYALARAGEIRGFTGIDDPYEVPTGAEVTVDTEAETVEKSTRKVIDVLESLDFLPSQGAGTEAESANRLRRVTGSGRASDSKDAPSQTAR